MSEVEVVSAQEEPTEADKDRIATLDSVMSQPEVVVGEAKDTVPPAKRRGRRMLKVRLQEDVEEMSVVQGGKRETYSFSAGHEYNVPIDIALELNRLGKVFIP